MAVSDLLTGVPEVENNPLGERICKVFTHNSGGGGDSDEVKNMVDFKEFVKALSIFNQ